MTLVIHRSNDTCEVVSGQSILLNDGARVSVATLERATDADLNAINIWRVPLPSAPAGQYLTSVSYSWNGTTVVATGTFADVPPPDNSSDKRSAVAGTYRAHLLRRSREENDKGRVYEAVNLLLQAHGVQR